MISKNVKDFNKLFLEEINSLYQVKESIIKFNISDMNKMHRVIAEGLLHCLYSYFPTIIIFNPYFFIFSNTKNYVKRKKKGVNLGRTKFQIYSQTLSEEEKQKCLERGELKKRVTARLFEKHR